MIFEVEPPMEMRGVDHLSPFALELPTGDRWRASGNGTPEMALGLTADWETGAWSLRSGGGITWPLDQVERTPDLTAVPVLAGHLELGFRLASRTSVHLQVAGQSGPFRLDGELGDAPSARKETRGFTQQAFQLVPAVSWNLGGKRTLFIGVVEDFLNSEDSASDLALFPTLAVGF